MGPAARQGDRRARDGRTRSARSRMEDAELAEEWAAEVDGAGVARSSSSSCATCCGARMTPRCAGHDPSGRGRHRVAGLGRDAAAHVLALGRAHGFEVELLDYQPGEEAGIKSATLEIRGRVRLRLPEGGEGRAPARAHLARSTRRRGGTRRSRACSSTRWWTTTIEIEINEKDLRDRHVPRGRRGRPAREQDRLGGADHAHPDGHRRGVPERAEPAPEQGDGDEDAARPRCTSASSSSARRSGQRLEAEKTDIGLGQPDPVLRLPAVHDGDGPPDRAEDRRRAAA